MGQFSDNGLSDVTASERHRLLLILADLPAIEAWGAGLGAERKRRLNHPNTIWMHWRQVGISERAAEGAARRAHRVIANNGGKPHRSGRAVFWP
jgi:hypothetical protein